MTLKTNFEHVNEYLELLNRLAEYLKAVPVAHSKKGRNMEDILFLDKNNRFFVEDFSYVFGNSRHTGVELVALWRKLDLPPMVKSDIDVLFRYNERLNAISSHVSDYRKTVHVALNSLEAFCRNVVSILGGSENEARRWIFNSFFILPFRESDSNEKKYLIPVGDRNLRDLFLTIKRFRNDSTHHNVTSFSAPESDEQLIKYCCSVHFDIIIFVLVILERFYDELLTCSCNESDFENTIEELGKDERISIGKSAISIGYTRRVKEYVRKLLQESFRGTVLYNKPEVIENNLPELRIRVRGQERKEKSSEVFSGNSGRILVTGLPGSGKSVLIFKMILEGIPHLLPLYFTADEFNEECQPGELVSGKVFGAENLTISPKTKACGMMRLTRLLNEGEVVFFVDSIESGLKNLDRIIRFIDAYPQCRVIAATQPDEADTVWNALSGEGFTCYEICPFDREQAKHLMRIYSILLNNVDHSRTLEYKIRMATDGLSIMRHPLSLLLLIHLFETNPNLTIDSINRTRLYRMMIQSIEDNRLLDVNERNLILEQPFIRQYYSDVNEILSLGSKIKSLMAERKDDDCIREIEECSFMSSDDRLRTMFEIMELLPEIKPEKAGEISALRTLVTVTMSDGRSKDVKTGISFDNDGNVCISDTELPAPSGNLEKLASAISTIGYYEPSEKETDRRDSRILYRLRPKFIVESYVANMLLLYGKYDIHSDCIYLQNIFKTAAILSTSRLLDIIFSFRWLKEWLYDRNDTEAMKCFEFHALKDNMLARKIIDSTTDSVSLLERLIRQFDIATALKLSNTVSDISGYINEILSSKMNDDQLEHFILSTVPSLENIVDSQILVHWKNVAIASMDSLSLADRYDTSNSWLPNAGVQEKLFSSGSKSGALKILAMLLHSATKNSIKRSRYRMILEHLIKFKAYDINGLKDIFWENISEGLGVESFREDLLAYLDIIPIESIPDKISLQLYDQRIIRYQISLALDWKKRQIQWIKTPPVWSNDRLFRQVSKSCSSIRQISYSLYSHPSDTTYIVCAESVSEMPEGKFCRLGNFDQWFSVQDVQDLKEEHPISQVAYVSLVLDDWIPRKESGNIRINSDKIGRTIPYVYLYCEGNNVVIRVEDSVSAAFLADKANVADIKESPSCQFNGNDACIVGIDIYPVNPLSRLIWLHPVRNDGSEYSKVPVAVDSFPEKGYMKFYHCKKINEDVRKYGALTLKLLSRETVAMSGEIEKCMYLGAEKGIHYIAVPFFLEEKQWIRPSDGTWAAQVVGSVDIRENRNTDVCVPDSYKGLMWKLRRKGGKSKDCFFISGIRHYGNIPECKCGEELTMNAKVCYYEPLSGYIPEKTAVEPLPDISVDYVIGTYAKIDNNDYIALPITGYPQKAKFYYSDIMPRRMPVEWAGRITGMDHNKVYLILDKSMLQLWRNRRQNKLQFFTDANIPDPVSVTFSSVLSLVDLSSPEKYHGSIVDILIREWLENGNTGSREYNFCQAKGQGEKFLKYFKGRIKDLQK